MPKVIGIVGSYRKNGTIDQLVTEVLRSAEANGCDASKIYLLDKHIEFCTNCRLCTQEPGETRGVCPLSDDMEEILKQYDECDGIVIGSPINCFSITAITKRFMERLVPYAYWPWGVQTGPRLRRLRSGKKAVLITSTSMPVFMARLFTGGMKSLRVIAATIGAKVVGTMYVGRRGIAPDQPVPTSYLRKANKLGRKLAH